MFESVYRVMTRLMERGGQSIYLMLCALTDDDGTFSAPPEERGRRFEEALCASLRRTDVVCRWGESMYLALLVNTTREDCEVVQARISARFPAGEPGPGVQYYVASLYRG